MQYEYRILDSKNLCGTMRLRVFSGSGLQNLQGFTVKEQQMARFRGEGEGRVAKQAQDYK